METITTSTTIITIISIINQTISPAITWAAEIICTEVEDQCHHEAAAIQATPSTTTEAREDQDQMVVDEATEKINQRIETAMIFKTRMIKA